MTLSAPVYQLKRRAKLLARQSQIPLHQALDQVAREEGFQSWSLLLAKLPSPAQRLYEQLQPGDLVLLAARPGQGKTLLSLELTVQAENSYFFTLESTESEVLSHLKGLNLKRPPSLKIDTNDSICADYIAQELGQAPKGTLVVIDYLQLLDQKRQNPDLATQVRALKQTAIDREITIVCISQIDRHYDPKSKPCPDLSDVRLPNPVDVDLFNKTCFLHAGQIKFGHAMT
ncbi:MAG: DNA helicase [Armatimonadetes bacterium 55-13]|nr:DNA helicase [Armatimonadota bacterium]OJU61657.1 MAG: DNA helicase [Armatimonadetes bacterium 55-13]